MERSNFTQQKYNSLAEVVNRIDDASAACITAISGKAHAGIEESYFYNGVQEHYDGEFLNIYPLHTEFRPYSQEDQKKDFDKIEKYRAKVNSGKFSDRRTALAQSKLDFEIRSGNQSAEGFVYPNKAKSAFTEQSKRGIVTHMSAKSSLRCKKVMSRMPSIDFWIDLTFSDDVFQRNVYGFMDSQYYARRGEHLPGGVLDMTFQDRLKKSYDCLNRFMRFIKKMGLYLLWKKEIQRRKSGVLKGKRVPHYHCTITGMTEAHLKHWEQTAVILLKKWVDITGTQNPNALKVALHRRNGSASSYRKIENSKMAICYITKYFSKTDEKDASTKDGEPESIGRSWGKSKGMPLVQAHRVKLNRVESIKVRRLMRKYKRLKFNKKFIGVREQLSRGYSTFLFVAENTILRYLLDLEVDLFPDETHVSVPF